MAEKPAHRDDSDDEWLAELIRPQRFGTPLSHSPATPREMPQWRCLACGQLCIDDQAHFSRSPQCEVLCEQYQRSAAASARVSTSASASTLAGALERLQSTSFSSFSSRHQRPQLDQQTPNSAAYSAAPAAGSASAPPSIRAIRADRLQREHMVHEQEKHRQKAIWDQKLKKRAASPEARRSGRKSSKLSREGCSSRSRSPEVCERLARSETALISDVTWEYHVGILNPDIELIVNKARAAICSWISMSAWPGESAVPSYVHCVAGAVPNLFYVGVSRYLERRWFGGDNLSFEESHCFKWSRLHVLSTHAYNVGVAEDLLITRLRREFGFRSCANINGGGGGASGCKPCLLYICVGPIGRIGAPPTLA